MGIKQRFTHKGWFYFVPVYVSGIESGQDMQVAARWIILEPLIDVASFIHNGICTIMREDIPFPFRITGEL